MEITLIEKQKKFNERFNIFIDGKYYCGLMAETIVKNHIKTGMEIDEHTLQEIVFSSEVLYATNKSVNLLSKSLKTEKQIEKYLYDKGFLKNVVDATMEKLKSYNLINDEIFAKTYVKSKQSSSGPRKISFELKQKGIDKAIIFNSLKYLTDESASCLKLGEKFIKNKEKIFENKQKLYRHLASKGFSNSSINFAIDKIFNEKDYDGDEYWD